MLHALMSVWLGFPNCAVKKVKEALYHRRYGGRRRKELSTQSIWQWLTSPRATAEKVTNRQKQTVALLSFGQGHPSRKSDFTGKWICFRVTHVTQFWVIGPSLWCSKCQWQSIRARKIIVKRESDREGSFIHYPWKSLNKCKHGLPCKGIAFPSERVRPFVRHAVSLTL